MKQIVFCFTLLLAAVLLAQQQAKPPPPTPPTFSQPQTMSGQLPSLRAEPSLAGTNVDAKANGHSVGLGGRVDTMAKHDGCIAQANSASGRLWTRSKAR